MNNLFKINVTKGG